jgi:hypothetical protein
VFIFSYTQPMPLIPQRDDSQDEWLVTDPQQLRGLSPLPLLHVKGRGRILLGGSMETHHERDAWEQELNNRYYACGCGEGSIAMMAALAFGLIWAVVLLLLGMPLYAYTIESLVALGVGGALLGKAYGLLYAHFRLRRLVNEIQTQWQA